MRCNHILLFALTTALLLVACDATDEPTEPDCYSRGVLIVPTPTRPTDPDLSQPPQLPMDGGDGRIYCATPIPGGDGANEPPLAFVTTDVVNLSLLIDDQDLAAIAVGEDMLAVAWLTGGDLYLALARGGNQFQVRRIAEAEHVSMVFSNANRLHVVYEQAGQFYYRAADEGVHPAEVEAEFVTSGHRPQVVLNQYNYAQVIYELDGGLYHAAHILTGDWQTGFVTDGSQVSLVRFGSDIDLGYIVSYRVGEAIHMARWQTTPYGFFPFWEPLTTFPIPAGETLTGQVGLDFRAASEDDVWVYAAWVTKRPFPQPPTPTYSQPLYDAANPLFPDQVANPHHIYQGLNAARWGSETPFDAGLRQTIAVPNPHEAISVSGWGLVETAPTGDLTLRLGLDPTGSTNPEAAGVIWSASASPTDFANFSVSAAPAGGQATLFLHATHNGQQPSRAVWDAVAVHNGTLTNGDFEEAFSGPVSLEIPAGWTPYYTDSGAIPPFVRDQYTVYAAWSDNGGSSWTGPETVAANQDSSGAVTGAIGPDVYPLISLATEPPTINFFYIYETGDPPPNSAFLRFGRPHQSQCPLGTADCTTPPGSPLLHPGAARPSTRLLAAPDPQQNGRAVLAWDGLQSDNERRDVYATYAVLR
jgi:hypothetical protein